MSPKTCAYHLCARPLDPELVARYPTKRYCDARCRANALSWRWRHRKPRARALQQHCTWLRKQQASIKRLTAKRRRPLLALVTAKAALADSRKTPTEDVA